MASPAVEKAAESAWLKIIARGGMALALPVLSSVAWFIWNDHDAIGLQTLQINSTNSAITQAQQDIKDLKSWEVDTNNTVSSVETRVSVVETNQKNGADRGQQFQTDTKAALSKLNDQELAILQQLAAINATLSRGVPAQQP